MLARGYLTKPLEIKQVVRYLKQRQPEVLTVSNIKDDGLHIQRHKTAASTGKRTVYVMDP